VIARSGTVGPVGRGATAGDAGLGGHLLAGSSRDSLVESQAQARAPDPNGLRVDAGEATGQALAGLGGAESGRTSRRPACVDSKGDGVSSSKLGGEHEVGWIRDASRDRDLPRPDGSEHGICGPPDAWFLPALVAFEYRLLETRQRCRAGDGAITI
jgi:hypothetical protein